MTDRLPSAKSGRNEKISTICQADYFYHMPSAICLHPGPTTDWASSTRTTLYGDFRRWSSLLTTGARRRKRSWWLWYNRRSRDVLEGNELVNLKSSDQSSSGCLSRTWSSTTSAKGACLPLLASSTNIAANLPPEECELLHLLATPLSIYPSKWVACFRPPSRPAGSVAEREGGGSDSDCDQSAD